MDIIQYYDHILKQLRHPQRHKVLKILEKTHTIGADRVKLAEDPTKGIQPMGTSYTVSWRQDGRFAGALSVPNPINPIL